MRVLVTGANGFVGRALVKRRLAAGDSVIAAVGPGASGGPVDAKLTHVSLDVTNDVSVRACFAEPVDAVIHLAAIALSRAADRDPAMAWRVNAEGTAKLTAALVEAAAQWRTQPIFLLASTADVYAWQQRPTKEEDCVQPSTAYATSKLGAELATRQAERCRGLKVIIARPFLHSGPGQDESFWLPARCKMLREAKRAGWAAVPVGDLTAVRDFLHVDDVADAYALLLQRGVPGEVYNIASGRAVTLEAIHTRLEQLLGVAPKHEMDASQVRREARPYLVGDAAKLRAATGWSPRRTLDDILRDVLDAQKN
ncbi:MAG: GDP-4-dehydro-6-deoxy-D-mannose reductase [Gemmatimonadetes bacterium]|nr:MAG: GDP-4-dehydro-6-deoxy-D-mannose reductase [Gemmatimonadota bacterium]